MYIDLIDLLYNRFIIKYLIDRSYNKFISAAIYVILIQFFSNMIRPCMSMQIQICTNAIKTINHK